MDELRIRAATTADAPELLAIYAPYVRETAITFEYEAPSVDEFAERIANVLKKYPYLAAEHSGEIVGYAYAGPFKARAAYGWAVESTVYVKRSMRRCGVGRALYTGLEHLLAAQHITNVNACIAVPIGEDPYLTRDSVTFHTRLGYRMVGEFDRCAYKFGRWYSMVWMEKHIGAHLTPQPEVIPFPEIQRYIDIDSAVHM